jgi:hypothetical protein
MPLPSPLQKEREKKVRILLKIPACLNICSDRLFFLDSFFAETFLFTIFAIKVK